MVDELRTPGKVKKTGLCTDLQRLVSQYAQIYIKCMYVYIRSPLLDRCILTYLYTFPASQRGGEGHHHHHNNNIPHGRWYVTFEKKNRNPDYTVSPFEFHDPLKRFIVLVYEPPPTASAPQRHPWHCSSQPANSTDPSAELDEFKSLRAVCACLHIDPIGHTHS